MVGEAPGSVNVEAAELHLGKDSCSLLPFPTASPCYMDLSFQHVLPLKKLEGRLGTCDWRRHLMNPLYCDLRISQTGQVRPRALIFEVANG
jgi:hypothetical protein